MISPIPSLRPFRGWGMAKKRPTVGNLRPELAWPRRKARRRFGTPLPLRKLYDQQVTVSSCPLLSMNDGCSRLAVRGAPLSCLQSAGLASHRDAATETAESAHRVRSFPPGDTD